MFMQSPTMQTNRSPYLGAPNSAPYLGQDGHGTYTGNNNMSLQTNMHPYVGAPNNGPYLGNGGREDYSGVKGGQTNAPTSQGGGRGIWDAISDIFKGSRAGPQDFRNPADAGMPYLDQIEGRVSPYYQPYIDAGRQALPELQKQFMSMLSDPGALMKRISAGFQQSPGYQWNVDQATKAANNAGAASGMLGTPAEQAELAKTTHGLADNDFEQYLGHALGLYGGGISGLSGINQMGYNASGSLADVIGSILMNKSNMAYSGAANQNEMDAYSQMQQGQQDDFFGDALGILGPAAANFFLPGAGGAASAASSIFSKK